MGIEIERKYLVDEARLRPLLGDGVAYCQGYLSSNELMAVRVRIAGERAWLTVKGAGKATAGGPATRPEFEYPIPLSDASEMLEQLVSGGCVRKQRYHIRHQGYLWEVDIFEGDNAGLIVAEVELESESAAPELPDWVTQDVSADPRYLNSNLAQHPFSEW